MARLTFPTAADLRANLKEGAPPHQVDPLATAQHAEGMLRVRLTDGTTTMDLTGTAGIWTVSARQGDDTGQPLVLPEALVARANRLMQAEGVSITRDWRTKAHTLRAAQRRVLPLIGNAPVSAVRQPDGSWRAMPGAAAGQPSPANAPSGATGPQPDPAPTPSAAPTSATTAPGGASMPAQGIPAAYRGTVVLSKATRAKWAMARSMRKAGEPAVVAFVGPSGAGKTHAVHALAAEEGLDVVKFDASGVVEPGDWFGTVTLDGNGTRFVPSDLLLAITLPGPRVLLVDEANRANLRALNAMLPVFDGSGTVTIPQSGKRERVNPEVQVVVTANIGSAFLATEPLDEAIRTRVAAWIEVQHLGEAEEAQLLGERVEGLDPYHAANLARLGAALRQSAESGAHPPVSTRQLLAAAWMIAGGGDPRLAVDTAILDGYSDEGGSASERAKVRTHVAGITWRKPTDQPSEGQPGDVYTSESGDCRCSHGPTEHGIGSDISVSTHCRTCARAYPGQAHRQCMAYSPVMQPA